MTFIVIGYRIKYVLNISMATVAKDFIIAKVTV